jgi:hypothetical protein
MNCVGEADIVQNLVFQNEFHKKFDACKKPL